MADSSSKQPVLFVGHGGGPLFLMNVPEGSPGKEIDGTSPSADALRSYFQKKFAGKTRPTSILVISAHWEGDEDLEVLVKDPPDLLFDYYGFPGETYKYKYPCRHSPELATKVQRLLGEAGMKCSTNTTRGLDHGVFIPLLLLLPEANIPVVQLSLHCSLDPSLHLKIGQALAPLRSQGVFILGSGMTTHNLRFGMQAGVKKPVSWAKNFADWLEQTMLTVSSDERNERLKNWARLAPDAQMAHPRSEHLLPLHVIAGAAGNDQFTKEWDAWGAGHFSMASYGTKN